jgi:hypothetical protein
MFIFGLYANLTKSSCWWLSVWLHPSINRWCVVDWPSAYNVRFGSIWKIKIAKLEEMALQGRPKKDDIDDDQTWFLTAPREIDRNWVWPPLEDYDHSWNCRST